MDELRCTADYYVFVCVCVFFVLFCFLFLGEAHCVVDASPPPFFCFVGLPTLHLSIYGLLVYVNLVFILFV